VLLGKGKRFIYLLEQKMGFYFNFSTFFAASKCWKNDRNGTKRYWKSDVIGSKSAQNAQKDLADGKKTLKAYYWYICGQEYDQEHGN